MARVERRSAVALSLSVGLHLCALALWVTQPVEPKRPAAPTPFQLTEVVWLPAKPPRRSPVVQNPRVPTTPPVVQPPRGLTASPLPAVVQPPRGLTASPLPAVVQPPRGLTASPLPAVVEHPRGLTPSPPPVAQNHRVLTPTPAEPATEARIDATARALDLTPRLSGSGDVPQEAPRGRTLTPADLPSSEELQADEQARVEARVGSWLKTDLGQARVRGGLPDPEYGELGRSLRAATDDVPAFIDTNSAREVLGALKESWQAGAERYGKTGAPYAEPEGRLESIERPSSLVDAAANGSRDAMAVMNFLSAGARLQEFADGRAGLELYALVELKQTASGTLEAVTLVRPSGLRAFDTWVQERARTVALEFSLDGGARTRPLRSVWRFDGILKFRRKLKPKELDGRAVLGMIAMSALSSLANLDYSQLDSNPERREDGRLRAPRMPGLIGRFDELTGEIDVVDFTNPTYDCTVRLLEAD